MLTSEAATQPGPALPFLLDVQGTSFVSGAQIEVGGTPVATTFISATELQANYTPANGVTSAALSVVNPAPGSAVSASANVQLLTVKVSVAAAARLLDQATFGVTATDIQHVQSVGLDPYLNEQFAMAPTVLADLPNPAADPVCALEPEALRAERMVGGGDDRAGPAAAARGASAERDLRGVDELGEPVLDHAVPQSADQGCVQQLRYRDEGCDAFDRDGRVPEHAEQRQAGGSKRRDADRE